MTRYVFAVVVAVVMVVLGGACSSTDSRPATSAIDGASKDAEADDTNQISTVDGADANADESDANDADVAPLPATYNNVTDTTKWETFEVSGNVPSAGSQYEGGAFDGRYVYFAPSGSGRIARYDTTAKFDQASGWAAIDLTTLNVKAFHFAGAVFTGRYLFFIPTTSNVIARFDTQGDFLQGVSWTFLDIASFDPLAAGYFSGAFDGHYLYLAPSNGRVARFDPQSALSVSSAWTFFDLATVGAGLTDFAGIGFDGRYMYYTPFGAGGGHVVVRYDTTLSFAQAASWSTFDIGAVDVRGKGFAGSVFDGRHVYFIPWITGGGFLLTRYDTLAPFGQTTSWSTFDTTMLDAKSAGFEGAQFDGRFVYLVPFGTSSNKSGLVIRFDTTKAQLNDLSGWSKFDLTTKSATANGFAGGAFDGTHVYFVGDANITVARFNARSPASLGTFTPSFL